MGSFYDVVNGNPTNAADANQYADRLNGTTAGAVTLLATAANAAPLTTVQPSTPTADQVVVSCAVSGDAAARTALYMRSADGYGGLLGGPGGSTNPTAHLYAQSGGWVIPEALSVTGAVTVAGTVTVPGLIGTTSVFTNPVANGAPFRGSIGSSSGDVVQLTGTSDTFNIGIDSNNQMYIYDTARASYVFRYACGTYDALAGRIPVLSSAGGGGAGTHIFVGTTDPGAGAGEGDIWFSA